MAPSANEQTEDAVTPSGEQSLQQDKEIVIPKKPTPGRKAGGKKRGRGGRITSPRDNRDRANDVSYMFGKCDTSALKCSHNRFSLN